MARLPVPGGDTGNWGDILNEFLEQSLQPDGSIKPAALQQAGAAKDNDVVKVSGSQTISGVKTFSSPPVVPAPVSTTDAANKGYVDNIVSSGAPDADASTKGLVRLTGHLGGTADSPTVPGLADKADANHTHSVSDITDLNLDVGEVGEVSLGAETVSEGQEAIGIIKINSGDPVPPGTPANSIIIVVGE